MRALINLQLVLIVLALLMSCLRSSVSHSKDDTQIPTTTDRLPVGVYPLSGLESSLPNNDLSPLAAVVSDASIVGLGECEHFSGGFHKARVRVIKDLIINHGFRSVAFESPWAGLLPATMFVKSGIGTSRSALQSITPPFRSPEVLELLDWLRQFNVDHPNDKAFFFGFDEQELGSDFAKLSSFLNNAAPADSAALLANIQICGGTSEEKLNQCKAGMTAIDFYLDAHKDALTRATSPVSFELAQVSSIAIRAAAEGQYFTAQNNRKASDSVRDAAMAKMFSKLRHALANNAKTILWAHNGHLMKRVERTPMAFADKNMGSFLADEYGSQYKMIASIAYEIEVLPQPGMDALQAADPDSLEAVLRGFGRDYLFVDAKSTLFPPGQSLIFSYFYAVPAEQLDGFIFLQKSPAMTLIQGN